MTNAVRAERFERVASDQLDWSGKIRNRSEFTGLGGMRTGSAPVGDFLSRIWANYGPPDSVAFEGFAYAFRDKQTGLPFSAYAAGSGPPYGGFPKDQQQLMQVLAAFDNLLVNTTPADCQIEYDTDFGPMRSGSRDGKPFDEEIGPRNE